MSEGASAPPPADDELGATIAGCTAAHRRLFTTLDGIGDDMPQRPSRLPGWTIGHVLTHLARNADSHVRMLEGAARGEHLEQYAGGYDQRSADIEAGAGRTATALVDDVRASTERLERAWAEAPAEAWNGHGWARARAWPCRRLPFDRWREVELHHVDLGLGYEPADWPADFVAGELPLVLDGLPDRLPETARAELLAWLVGRADQPGPLPLAGWK